MEPSNWENRSVLCAAGRTSSMQEKKVPRFPQGCSRPCWEPVPARRRWSWRGRRGACCQVKEDEGSETQLWPSSLPRQSSQAQVCLKCRFSLRGGSRCKDRLKRGNNSQRLAKASAAGTLAPLARNAVSAARITSQRQEQEADGAPCC